MAIGRPRDPEVDTAAMSAAVRLIVEDGFPALTMDRVAERAGVSKAALYRRWPNKVSLVGDLVAAFSAQTVTVPDTGTVAGDVTEVLVGLLRERQRQAEIFEALTAAFTSSPELAARCREEVFSHFKSVFRAVVERGVARGELPADSDVELLADLAPALVRFHRQATGRRTDVDYIRRIVRQFFTVGDEPGGRMGAGA